MKKYLILFLLPVVIYFFWDKKENVKPIPQVSPATASKKKPSNKQLFFGKRPKLKSTLPVASVCDDVQTSLDDMDFMNENVELITEAQLDQLKTCLSPEFHPKLAEIKSLCFGKNGNKQLCFSNVVMLRGVLRSKHLLNPETRSDLADLMMSEFAKPVPDFKKLKSLAKKLLLQDPNDLPVQKVWAMSSVVASGDPAKITDAEVDEIYQVMDQKFVESDPELRGLNVILKTKLNPQSVEQLTRDYLTSNPEDLSSKEMLGWSLWQQGRREEAIAQVDAILLQKDDPWLRDMRNKLAAPDAKKDSYQGRINIGIRLEDLWE